MIAEPFLTFPGLECWCWTWWALLSLWVFAVSSLQWQFCRCRNKDTLSKEPCPPPTQMLASILIIHLLLADVRSVVFRLGERQVLLFQGCCQFASMSWSCGGCFCRSSHQHIWVILSFPSFISALIASFTLLLLTLKLAEWNRVGLQHIQANTHKIVSFFVVQAQIQSDVRTGEWWYPSCSDLKMKRMFTCHLRTSVGSDTHTNSSFFPVTFLVSFARCSPESLGESLQSKHEQSSAVCGRTQGGKETL